ncbi:hypothetical protein EON67_00790, partial [archaeon]
MLRHACSLPRPCRLQPGMVLPLNTFREVLHLTPCNNLEETIVPTCYSFIRVGLVPDLSKGKVLSTGTFAAPHAQAFTLDNVVAGLKRADGTVAPAPAPAPTAGAGASAAAAGASAAAPAPEAV